MNAWTGLCCDRIAAAELIDGEDVRISFLNKPDLEVTAEGLRMCRKILECYVSQNILTDAHEVLCLEESARCSINEVARILREMKWYELFRICVSSDEDMRGYAREELCQRLCLAGYREKLRRLCCNVIVRIKYRNLIAACKEIRGECSEKH